MRAVSSFAHDAEQLDIPKSDGNHGPDRNHEPSTTSVTLFRALFISSGVKLRPVNFASTDNIDFAAEDDGNANRGAPT
ncbi:hypothetical protein CDAR_602541 [Caerostris darwini]|uniref:Uncharacterized protein n=1 Tax=Caerostris darwini TaxID=1538125 RepID=A0AAV4TQG3_9ARAC|nr:hypothetical protein CDAR_602541 [Caerostris darwini]